MRIELTFTRNRPYARRVHSYLCRRLIVGRFILGTALILLSVPFWVVESMREPALGTITLAFGLVTLGLAALTSSRLAGLLPAYWYAPQTMTFTEETAAYRTEVAGAEIAWSAFTAVDLCDDALLLRIGAAQVWDVPRSALTDAQTLELIKRFTRRSLPAAIFLNEHERVEA